MKVAVVTPTIGSKHLKQCLDSVENQTYDNITHYVFVDGKEYHIDVQIETLDRDKVKTVILEENVGKGWYGHRVYAACSFLVNADIICYLDEDNWIDPDHVEKLVSVIEQGNDWAFSLRKIHNNHTEIGKGIWSQKKGAELFRKTIGLLGFGNIGQKFASFLAPFDCKIIFFDEKVFTNQELLHISKDLGLKPDLIHQDELSAVLHRADILSIHLPLLPETEDIISTKELSLLKPSISIINTARGGIVNESALHAFLSSKPDSFAAFDVYAEEPAIENPLFELPNFFGTSHRSSLTQEGINAMGLAAIAGLDDNKILT